MSATTRSLLEAREPAPGVCRRRVATAPPLPYLDPRMGSTWPCGGRRSARRATGFGACLSASAHLAGGKARERGGGGPEAARHPALLRVPAQARLQGPVAPFARPAWPAGQSCRTPRAVIIMRRPASTDGLSVLWLASADPNTGARVSRLRRTGHRQRGLCGPSGAGELRPTKQPHDQSLQARYLSLPARGADGWRAWAVASEPRARPEARLSHTRLTRALTGAAARGRKHSQ